MCDDKLIDIHDEWLSVTKRKNKKPKNFKSFEKINKNTIIDKSKEIFKKYMLKSVFLFGSVAKNTHTIHSDIDFLLIWNKHNKNFEEALENIQKDLCDCFKKNVDLTSMIYVEKLGENNKKNYPIFLENVMCECDVIFGDILDIELSRYIGKYRNY